MPRLVVLAIRALRAGRGRWVAIALTVVMCAAIAVPSKLPIEDRLRLTWFDTYQRVYPRERLSGPVTIVEVDARALRQFGQWPWPRVRLAELIERIGKLGALAIGLDIIMAEEDQTSPEALLARIGPGDPAVIDTLSRLPAYDEILAATIRRYPVVLGAAGFDTAAPSTRVALRTWPIAISGGDVSGAIRHYPYSLASLQPLQIAASGQGLLSADLEYGVVRRVPMVSRVRDTLIPSFTLELLRVATGSTKVELQARNGEVDAMRVGDVRIPTLPSGEIWVHFSRQIADRYISALDVMTGKADPDLFKHKIVIVALTGMGLMDYKTTPLGDYVPGVDAHAQMIESFFDNRHLTRPQWMPLAEALVLAVLAGALIRSVPAMPRHAAAFLLLVMLVAVCVFGFAAFFWYGLLVDSASLMVGLVVLFASLFAAALAQADHERRLSERSLHHARETAARVAGELEGARRIQMGILPRADESFPSETRFELAATVEPARTVGGDLYDFFMLDADRLFIQIADVSGKGIPASLFMSITKVLTKSVALRSGSTDIQPLTQANVEISRDNPESLFVTAYAAVLDVATGELRYWTAGHDTPYLRSAKGVSQLDRSESGPPLCVLVDYEYPEQRFVLEPGTVMVLFTDGVTEAQNAKEELYGKERLEACLEALPPAPSAADTMAAIQRDVARFVGGAPATDDLTLLVLRWPGPAGALSAP